MDLFYQLLEEPTIVVNIRYQVELNAWRYYRGEQTLSLSAYLYKHSPQEYHALIEQYLLYHGKQQLMELT